MKTTGVRILDRKENKCISFSEILNYIKNEKQLYWAILWLDVTPLKNKEKYILQLEKEINQSPNGLLESFDFLKNLSSKIFQEIEMLIIASKNKKNIHRYKKDQEMYETCDIVVEMIDGSYWAAIPAENFL